MDTNTNNNAGSCATCSGAGCGCGHHIVAPVAVILIGVSALLNVFGILTDNIHSIAWPILLIIAAGGKLCKCCK